ncbi:MAG: NAD(P)H-dependent glycerol-3-phosphate dehydrogenase [Cyanobacteria bacterium P01_H01_bin.74]
MKKLAILGAGSWGLTLSWLASGNEAGNIPKQVCLWDRSSEKITALKKNRTVSFPVSLTLPDALTLTTNLSEAVADADVIVLVVTVSGTQPVLEKIHADCSISKNTILVNASKGIAFPSLKRLSEIIHEVFPDNPCAVLSGPTLAREILAGLPTACSIACQGPETASFLQSYLSHNLFRLYSNSDVVGVELGGALKNIFAIASGYMREKKLGDNAVAAMLTRGLSEMTRFSVSMGANPDTLYGMSGLGDLLATANSPLSRNYQVGASLAKGEKLEDILSRLQMVAEGVKTTHAVYALSKSAGLETPIVDMVKHCLAEPLSDSMIIKNLMTRKLKAEGCGVK